jgi:hypothetical protein
MLATMLSGTMLAILDSSSLNVLVVPIMEEFKADLRTIEWALTSGNLAFADASGRSRQFTLYRELTGHSANRRTLHVRWHSHPETG